MLPVSGLPTSKSEIHSSSSQSSIFTTKNCLVAIGAITALGLFYFSYYQTDGTSQPESDGSSVANLGENRLAAVGQAGVYIAPFFQMAAMFAAQVGVGAHIQREERRGDQEKQSDFPAISHDQELSSFSNTVTSFYQNHRLELDKLSWKVSKKKGRPFSISLHDIGSDSLKDWKIVKKEQLQVTMVHAELEGLVFLFPTFSQNSRLTVLAEKHLKKEYFSFFNRLEEWRALLEGKYSQLVIPETLIIKNHSGSTFLAAEAITISPHPIGTDADEARRQFEQFRKEIGFSDNDVTWGENVGFVGSLAGESQSPHEPARIALLGCGRFLPFPKG